jgi:protein TonB
MNRKNGIPRTTLIWIAAVHILILALLFIGPLRKKPVPEAQFLEMVDLEAWEAPSTSAPPPPEPLPAPPTPRPPEPTPPEPSPPEPLPAPPEPAPEPVPDPVLPQPKPKPTPPKPKVEVDLTRTVHKATPAATPPSPTNIREKLSSSVKEQKSASPTPNEIAAYRALIKRLLYASWTRPGGLDSRLEATVDVRVQPDGSLHLVGLRESSGQDVFDQSALAAVRSVRKIPKPLPAGMGDPDYLVPIIFASQDN